jgi:hypothetical protein
MRDYKSLHRKLYTVCCWLAVVLLAPVAGAAEPLHAERLGDCDVLLESDPAGETLMLRSRQPAGGDCPLDRAATAGFLARAVERLPAGGGRYRSLFLGRLINHPWLGRFLAVQAAADAGWLAASGRPRAGGDNAYVAGVLARSDLGALVEAAFAPAGYRAGPPSVEKVLVSSPGLPWVPAWVPAGGSLPFDALCHVGLLPGEAR